MQIKQFIVNDTNIEYAISGSGKTVILLHGFAEDYTIWQNQIAHLQNNYQLILPNLPGAGVSSILQKNDVQLTDYADIINAILINENVASATFIGHSLGGYTALAFAEKYPTKINGLGLVHSTVYADNEEKIITRNKSIEFIQNHGSASFVKTMFANLFLEPNKHKILIEKLIENASKFSPFALVQYYKAMISRPDRSAILKDFKHPVLFIIGEGDKLIPFEESLKQTHIPSHAYIHILHNSGHMGMFEEVKEVNGFLFTYLIGK